MKIIPIIAALAILPLSAHAYRFSPASTSYKLHAIFHFSINGGPVSDCAAQLRGKTTAKGVLRIDNFDSTCLVIDNRPRAATAISPGMGFVDMAVSYGTALCGGGINFTVNGTGRLSAPTVLSGNCAMSFDGQFSPVITIVP